MTPALVGAVKNTRNAAGNSFVMLRFFGLLQKLNFLKITAYDLYHEYAGNFDPGRFKCPFCRTRHPAWKKHATYERYIVSFENKKSITYRVVIIRYRCSSCGHTHALLPEFLIPYRSYSLLFILTVLKDYFSSSLTIEKICEKYNISASTIYSLKVLFLRHKKIWLGLLEDSCKTAAAFIEACFDGYIIFLEGFHLETNLSFLQTSRCRMKAYSPP